MVGEYKARCVEVKRWDGRVRDWNLQVVMG